MAGKVYIIFFHGRIKHILTDRDKAYACLKYLNAGYNYYPAYSVEEFETDVFSVPETEYCEFFECTVEQDGLKFVQVHHKTVLKSDQEKNEVRAVIDEVPLFIVKIWIDDNDKKKAKAVALEEVEKYIEQTKKEDNDDWITSKVKQSQTS